MSQIILENGKKSFDTRVEIRDPKTGRVVKHQPYQFHVKRGANPEQWFTRAGIRCAVNGDPLDKISEPDKSVDLSKGKSSKILKEEALL